ncbi:MAG TPA: peptidoglycan editing factor PgeF [Gammaproteobacteria bacterium]|nr:peptidoglycan editing factor PgeF [Gammaproteobacteria bacterium]
MSIPAEPTIITPDWPAPASVRAAQTTRLGGVSRPPFDSFNLAQHTEDVAADVMENRRRLRQRLGLLAEPAWLTQVHGVDVVPAAAGPACADAAWTEQPGVPCVVMSADCLPVLFCDQAGEVVAAAHAGWRGLVGGVLEATVAAMGCPPQRLLAWLGPAIGPEAFEVGGEVRQQFIAADPAAAACFRPSPEGRWLADLYALARQRLTRAGVEAVYGGGFCTVRQAELFFSYRRDGRTGRMATLIWLER